MATILKNRKIQFIHNHMTDFDKIWHGDASLHSASYQPLKFLAFKNPNKFLNYIAEHTC